MVAVFRYKCNRCRRVCNIRNCSVKTLEIRNLSDDYDELDRIIARKLRVAFEEKHLHRNSDLTLESLAAECGTNRTYLSEFFNRKLNVSFTDYVNDYRIVRESIPLIRKYPHLPVSDIAMMSGFGSIATFRRAFFRKTGLTPSEFKAAVRKSKTVKQ